MVEIATIVIHKQLSSQITIKLEYYTYRNDRHITLTKTLLGFNKNQFVPLLPYPETGLKKYGPKIVPCRVQFCLIVYFIHM